MKDSFLWLLVAAVLLVVGFALIGCQTPANGGDKIVVQEGRP